MTAAPHVPPPSGLTVVMAAFSMPGAADTSSTSREASTDRAAPWRVTRPATATPAASYRPFARKPSGSVCSFRKLRITSPAPAGARGSTRSLGDDQHVDECVSRADRRWRPGLRPTAPREVGAPAAKCRDQPATTALKATRQSRRLRPASRFWASPGRAVSPRFDGTSVAVSGAIHAASSNPAPHPSAASAEAPPRATGAR